VLWKALSMKAFLAFSTDSSGAYFPFAMFCPFLVYTAVLSLLWQFNYSEPSPIFHLYQVAQLHNFSLHLLVSL
jgi:hypothetical protein